MLANLSWPDVERAGIAQKVVIAPLGAFEQHGPHLPFTTDTDIVTAIAAAVERANPDRIVLLPTLWLGHSTHHMRFPGTLDLRQMHYIALIQDLCRSIFSMGATKILLLNGHGSNDVPVRAALREVKTELAAAMPSTFSTQRTGCWRRRAFAKSANPSWAASATPARWRHR
jgi:creatinine amidohydrolase